MTAIDALDIVRAQYREYRRLLCLAWARDEHDKANQLSAQAVAIWAVSQAISDAILKDNERKRAAAKELQG